MDNVANGNIEAIFSKFNNLLKVGEINLAIKEIDSVFDNVPINKAHPFLLQMANALMSNPEYDYDREKTCSFELCNYAADIYKKIGENYLYDQAKRSEAYHLSCCD